MARKNTMYLDDELSLPSVRILLHFRQHFHKGQVSSPGGDLLSPGPSSAIKNPFGLRKKNPFPMGVWMVIKVNLVYKSKYGFFSVIASHRMYSFFKYLCSS